MQKSYSLKQQTSEFNLNREILKYWPSVLLAFLASVFLALFAALILTLIGPSLRLLLFEANSSDALEIKALFGERLGKLWLMVGGSNFITRTFLFEKIPLLLLCLAVFKSILATLQVFLWERVGEKLAKRMRHILIHAYLQLHPFADPDAYALSSEEIASILASDIRIIREYVVHFWGGIPRELMQICFLSITLFMLQADLAAIFFFALLPALALALRLGKKFKKRTENAQKEFSELTEWLQQRFLGVETIKHYGNEAKEVASLIEFSNSLYSKQLKAAKTKARMAPVVQWINIIALVALFVLVLWQIQTGVITAAIALSFFATLAMISQSGSDLSKYLLSNRQGAACLKRYQNVLLNFSQQTPQLKTSFMRSKEVKNCAFALDKLRIFSPRGEVLFNECSFSFSKGKIYCLHAASGAGKSTLLKAILGLYPLQSGQILLADSFGQDGACFGYMPQDSLVFSASVGLNVSYPDLDYDAKKAQNSLEKVGLKYWLEKQQAGLETLLGARGQLLSYGQTQRILLARLFYHRFPIILIDEGTSALDPEIEQEIYKLLRELSHAGSTILAISHRTSFFAYSDHILTIENGKLQLIPIA